MPAEPIWHPALAPPATSTTQSHNEECDHDEELPDAPATTAQKKQTEMSKPVLFYGKPNQVDDLVTFCKVKFLADGTNDESQKAGYLASLFRGHALSWLTEYMKRNSLDDFESLVQEIRRVFGLNETAAASQLANRLANLRQRGSVQQYALEFEQLATATKLPDTVARAQFVKGLKQHVQRGLVTADQADTLSEAIEEATRIDAELYSIGRNKHPGHSIGRGNASRDGNGRFKKRRFKSEPA